jgi:hypothetical protein
MAIISDTSVGSINYYLVNDIPTHVANKGSVAVLKNDIYEKPLTYINNGGNIWLKTIKPSYGQTLRYDSATAIDYSTLTAGSWYTIGTNWVYSNLNNFSSGANTGRLIYTGDGISRTITYQGNTFIGGAARWIEFSIGTLKNSSIPINYNNGNTHDNSSTINISTKRLDLTGPSTYYSAGISPVTREGGGAPTFTLRHYGLEVVKVDEPITITLINESFESGDFTTNGWTVVNGAQTNKWIVNTGTSYEGTYSAYASSGTSVSYNNTATSIVHFYKDFNIPSTFTTPDGNIKTVDYCYLDFRWRCTGENAAAATQYDYGAVVITTTGTTPAAGTEVSTTLAPSGGNGRIGGDSTYGKYNLAYINPYSGLTSNWQWEGIDLSSWVGQTKRLVFTWKNDNTAGANPPMCIDNIRIRYGFF